MFKSSSERCCGGNIFWCLRCPIRWWNGCMEAGVNALIPLKQGMNINLLHPQRVEATQTQQRSAIPNSAGASEESKPVSAPRKSQGGDSLHGVFADVSYLCLPVWKIWWFRSIPADLIMSSISDSCFSEGNTALNVCSGLMLSFADVTVVSKWSTSLWVSELLPLLHVCRTSGEDCCDI